MCLAAVFQGAVCSGDASSSNGQSYIEKFSKLTQNDLTFDACTAVADESQVSRLCLGKSASI